MKIDVFSATGEKLKSMDLPASLFASAVNRGLMHQAVVRQQSNRRQSAAHVQTRGEVQGSTRKLYAQKHTGRARRGPVRSPLLRGGGKIFGPRNTINYEKMMPKQMRHAALRSCLTVQAQKGMIVGLESAPDTIKTKVIAELLKKLPIEQGRRVLVVTAGREKSLERSARNIPNVTTVHAAYLNPESILNARSILFLVDAIKEAEKLFGRSEKSEKNQKNKKSDSRLSSGSSLSS